MKRRQEKKETLSKSSPDNSQQPQKEQNKNKISNLIGLAIIILLGNIIYSNSFNCSFHFDDFPNVVDKTFPPLTDLNAWWNLSQTRLVAYYSFALNIHFNGMNVWGFHLVNLMIHLINSCLVWWLTLLIFSSPVMKDNRLSKYKFELAFFSALLFVSHPLATQSVTYIVQRMTSMAAMFYLLSIVLYLKGRLTNNGFLLKRSLFACSVFSAVLAMFTKENAFTLPFAILLVEFFLLRTSSLKINFKDKRLWLLVAGIICFVSIVTLRFSAVIFKAIAPNEIHSIALTPVNYLLTQFSVIVKYLQLLFLPINQMVDYHFPVSSNFFESNTVINFLILVSALAIAIFLFNLNRVISFAIFFFLLTLSIESSIIPINDLIFEHRTYLPSVGYFLTLSSGIYLLLRDKSKIIVFIIFGLIIGTNSLLTYKRNFVWKDELTLWGDNVKKAPNLARPINNRGYAYRKLNQWQNALNDYNKSLNIFPDYPSGLLNRGTALAHFNQFDKAIADFTKAITLKPNFTEAFSNRGSAFASKRQFKEAFQDFSKSIQLDPDNAEAYYNRGNTFIEMNMIDSAEIDFSRAILLKKNYLEAYNNRGSLYVNKGEYAKAIDDFTKGIAINSKSPNSFFNRGIAYKSLKDWNNAIKDYSSALNLQPGFKEAYLNRGFAYGELGDWKKAIEDYKRAIQIDPYYEVARINLEFATKNLKSGKPGN